MVKKLFVSTSLIIIIVVIVNLLASEFHLRLDFTEDQEYTLSQATVDILEDLDDAVTIKAYFTSDLPPHITRVSTDLLELLIEFDNRSDGNIAYEFISPDDEAIAQEAMQSGIQPVMINVREKDKVTEKRAFLGVKLTYQGNQEIIPLIQPGVAMEYGLATAIKKLSVREKPVIGFVSGHGEPPLEEFQEVVKSLQILYTVEDVPVTDTTGIPDHVKTLAIIAPKTPFAPGHLQKIDQFIERGGRLFIGLNRVNVDLQSASGSALTTGLEVWLQEKGLVVNDDFVVDAKCASINVQQQMAFGMFNQRVPFPYLPIANKFSDHPASKGLESVMFRFASSVRYEGDTTIRFTPLVFSSEKSGAKKAPQQLNYQKQWTSADFTSDGLVIGGALEGRLSGTARSRMVVIGDGDFAVNGPADQRQRLQPDNVNLLVNGIDWLSDDTGLIDLRTKGASSRPIMQLEDGTKTIIKYVNFLLPILLAIGYGIFRLQRNKYKRFKWMSENYEEA